ncbi:hypothetical protein [Cellulomonas sp. S1-8]|uniref:hypothetical protein n=1 Tax=Cellulomonas sp. S1-8 TaxID=2904790 RepID=UPI002244ECE1|nr:hypothetical protein [Cellulomonas sp. S1-8]UZN04063.1 hypothetical protein OKX07_03755 [Cellulomonas sp. S1-8]
MSARTARPASPLRSERWWAARAALQMTACAVAASAVAFLWPASLGGCTSIDVVPAETAGADGHAGDVVVTRCGSPHVGDRVVHRGLGGSWTLGQVVARSADGWRLRGDDGVDRAVAATDAVVGVVRLQLPTPAAAGVPVSGAPAVAPAKAGGHRE